MTDYSKMTNDELNVAVAEKVMGWKQEMTFDRDLRRQVLHEMKYGIASDLSEYRKTWSGKVPIEYWEPAKYIEDAWQVVEKMISNKYAYELSHECYYGELHWCLFRKELPDIPDDYFGSAQNDNVCRAICEAALMAMDKRHDHN